MTDTLRTSLEASETDITYDVQGKRLLLLTVATATGMLLAALDSNITATAMPTVVASLGGLSLYSWVFAGYALASTTAMPLFGRLSDIYGRKNLYLGGMLLFVLASAACGSATAMWELILGRAIQGIGGAAIIALTFTIIADLYPPERRGQVQGVTSSAWAVSAIVGPALGALLVTTLGWRWVFFVNLPVSLIPILTLGRFFHDRPRRAGPRSVDVAGALVLSGGVVCLMFAALNAGNDLQLFSPVTVGFFLASIVLFAGFVAIERRVAVPTVPLELFRGRMFLLATIGSLVFGWTAFCLGVYIPLFAQGVGGGTAIAAGAVLLPNTLMWSLAAAISGPLVRPVGYRRMSLIGFGLLVAAGVLLARLNESATVADLIVAMVLAGLGSGVLSPTLLLAIQNAVDPNQLGVATSLAMFMRNIGYSIGVSIFGAILAGGLASRLGGAIANPGAMLVGGMSSGLDPALATKFRVALAGSMHDVFVLSLAITVLGILVSTGMTAWGRGGQTN